MKLNFEGNDELKTIEQSILLEVKGCERLANVAIDMDYVDEFDSIDETSPYYTLHAYLILQFENDVEIGRVWTDE